MRLIFAFLMLLVPTGAQAEPARASSKDDGLSELDGPPLYARGCYWHRGTRYCSQYCYVEINGRRFCNTRESEAVPQGDPYQPVRPAVEDMYRRPRRQL
jgi:hypothetical protein